MKKLPMAVTLISFVTVLAFPMALMAQTDDNAPAAVDVDEGTAEPAPNLDLTVDGAEPDAVAIALADDPEKPLTPGQKYKKFFERELEELGKEDRYGVTAQLPKRYLSIKWDYSQMTVDSRFNDKHKKGPAIAPIAMPGGFLDLGLSGYGSGHVFQASYGILGNFDWYFELPYQSMHVRIDPKFLDSNKLPMVNPKDPLDKAYAGRMGIAKLYEFIPQLGRPVPALRYDADWVLADINTGFSWNPWRTDRISTSLTCRVFMPTGRVAAANANLTMATGPEIDVGTGSWGLGFTNGWDFRIFKYKHWVDIIFSSEFSMAYYFPQKRDYPTNFTTEPNNSLLQMFNDPNVFAQFPDLRHLEGQYTYTPGFGISWMGQLQIQAAIFEFNVGYGVIHGQEPEIQGDWKFQQMVRSLQLLGQNTVQAVQLGASVSLIPLMIPVNVGFSWRKMVDGYNSLAMEDYWNVVVKAFIPLKW
ncbi:MAG TPA: hypothetical protein PKG98_10840 [Myxococcota bacterium]|nr:hypothetical protein [Myxococcota bacterium]